MQHSRTKWCRGTQWLLVVVLVGGGIGMTSAQTVPTAGTNGMQQGAATVPSRTPEQILYFRLQLNSLDPDQVTVEEGRYLIRLVNGVVLGDVEVQLDDEKKAHRINKGLKKGLTTFSAAVDLDPGLYVLKVAGAPQWSSSITVTKKSK